MNRVGEYLLQGVASVALGLVSWGLFEWAVRPRGRDRWWIVFGAPIVAAVPLVVAFEVVGIDDVWIRRIVTYLALFGAGVLVVRLRRRLAHRRLDAEIAASALGATALTR